MHNTNKNNTATNNKNAKVTHSAMFHLDGAGQGGVLSALQKLSSASLLLEEDLLGLVAKLDSIEYPAGLGCIRDEWCYYQLPLLASMTAWLNYTYLACPQLCYAHQVAAPAPIPTPILVSETPDSRFRDSRPASFVFACV
jgi:hypothetical protein